MAPVKVCLVLYPDQARFFDTVRCYQDLVARAATKWEQASPGCPPSRLTLTATDSARTPLFVVDSEEAYQKLELLFRRGLADAARSDGRTARVRLELREDQREDSSSSERQWERHDQRQLQPMSLDASRCSTPTTPQQPLQSWDEAALSSIKKSVALWHFGSRLQHHLAA